MVNFQLASTRPADSRPACAQTGCLPSLHAAKQILEATEPTYSEERTRALKSCFACLTLLRSHLTQNSFAWRTRFPRWQTILRDAKENLASESASLRTALQTRDVNVALAKLASLVSQRFRGPELESVRSGVRYLLPISSQHDKFLDDLLVIDEDLRRILCQAAMDLLASVSLGGEEEFNVLASHLDQALRFAEASLAKLPSGVVHGSPTSPIETLEELLRHATKMAHSVLLAGRCAAEHQRVSDRYSEFFRRVCARLRQELVHKWQISDLQTYLSALEADMCALAEENPLLTRLPRITLEGLRPRTYDLPALTLRLGAATLPSSVTLELCLTRGEDALMRLSRTLNSDQSSSDDLDQYQHLTRHMLASVHHLRSRSARAIRAHECLHEVTTQLLHWLDKNEAAFHAVRSSLVPENPRSFAPLTSATPALEDIDELNERLGHLDDIFAGLHVVKCCVISRQLPRFTAACLLDGQTLQLTELAASAAARFERLRISVTEAVSQGHHLLLECVRGGQETQQSERPAFLRRYRHTLGCLREWLVGALGRQQRRSQCGRRPLSSHGLLSFSARLATRWSLFTQLSQLLLADAGRSSTAGQDLPQDDATFEMEQMRLESYKLLDFWSQYTRVADVNVALLEAVGVECARLGEDLDEVETEATELEAYATQLLVFSPHLAVATVSKMLQHLKARRRLQVDRLQAIQSQLNNLAQTPVRYLDWPDLPAEFQTSAMPTPSSVRDAPSIPKISSVEGIHSRIASLVDRYQRLLPSTAFQEDNEERQDGAFILVESCETKITDLEAAASCAEDFLSILQRCMNQPPLPSAERSMQVNPLFLDCALQAQLNLMKELREKHAVALSCIQALENSINYDSLNPPVKIFLEKKIHQVKERFFRSIEVMDECCSVDFSTLLSAADQALKSTEPGPRLLPSNLSTIAAQLASETDLPSIRSRLFPILSNFEVEPITDDNENLRGQRTLLNPLDAVAGCPPTQLGTPEGLEQFLDSFVRFYSGLTGGRQMPVEVAHVPILLLRLRELERTVGAEPSLTEDPLHVKTSSIDHQSGISGKTTCGQLAELCSTTLLLSDRSQNDATIGGAFDVATELLQNSIDDVVVASQCPLSRIPSHSLHAQLLDVLTRLLEFLLLLGSKFSDLPRRSGHQQTLILNFIKAITRLDAQLETSADQLRSQQDFETAARAERELHVILLAMETVHMRQQSGMKERSPRPSLELLSVLLFNDGHLQKLLAESSSRAEQEAKVSALFSRLTQVLMLGQGEETGRSFADLFAAGGQLLSEFQNIPSFRNWKLSTDYMAALTAAVDRISGTLKCVRQRPLPSSPECSLTDIVPTVAETEALVYTSVCNYLASFVTFHVEAQQHPNILQSPTHLIEAFQQSLTSVLSLLDKTSVSEENLGLITHSDNYLGHFSTLVNFQVLSESDIYVRDAARVLGTIIELDLAFIHAHITDLETYCRKGVCTREKFRADFAAVKIALSESQRELEKAASSIGEFRQQHRDLNLRIFNLRRCLMIPPILSFPASLNAQEASSRILAFRGELGLLTPELSNFAAKLGLRREASSPDSLLMLFAPDRQRSCQSVYALRLMLQSCIEVIENWNTVLTSSVHTWKRFLNRPDFECNNSTQRADSASCSITDATTVRQLSDRESPLARASILASKRPQEVSRLNLGDDDWSLQQRRPTEVTSVSSEVNRLRRKIMGWLVPSLDEDGSLYARLSKDVSHRLTESLRDVDLIDEAYASNSITARSPVDPMNVLRRIDAECEAIVSGRLSERHAAAASARSRSLQTLIRSSASQATGEGRAKDLPRADASSISGGVHSQGHYTSVPNLTQADTSSRCERHLPQISCEQLTHPRECSASGVVSFSGAYYRNLAASTAPSECDQGRPDVAAPPRCGSPSQSSRLNWLTEAAALARTEVSHLQSHNLSSYKPTLRELRDICVRFLAFSHSVEFYLVPSKADRELPSIADMDLVTLEQMTQRWLNLLVTLVNFSEELKQEVAVWKAELAGTFTEGQKKQRLMSSISWWHDVLQTISDLHPPGHPNSKPLADLVAQIASIGFRTPVERPPCGSEPPPSLPSSSEIVENSAWVDSDPRMPESQAWASSQTCEKLARLGTERPIDGIVWCQRLTSEDEACTSLSGPVERRLFAAEFRDLASSHATPIEQASVPNARRDSEAHRQQQQQSFCDPAPSRVSPASHRRQFPSFSCRGWRLLVVLGFLSSAYFYWRLSRMDCPLNFFDMTLSLPGLTIGHLETFFADFLNNGQPPV
uniref:Uncharacterized protein n=3 Tax=Schistocephalus solidus TaxID=70667 RepID=A0A0X3PZS5_SCHSO